MFFLHAHMYQLKLQTYDLAKNYRVMPVCSQITHLKEILVLFLHVLVCEIRLLTIILQKVVVKPEWSQITHLKVTVVVLLQACVCAHMWN